MAEDPCRYGRLAIEQARAAVDNALQGGYALRFRGLGLEVLDFREYHPGDDVRYIDWRASARRYSAQGYEWIVREYCAERAARLRIILDASCSMWFIDKMSTALTVVAVLSHAAARMGDRVEAYVYGLEGSPLAIRARRPEYLPYAVLKAVCSGRKPATFNLREVRPLLIRRGCTTILVTDFAHELSDFDGLASAILSIRKVFGFVLVTSPLEVKPPDLGAAILYDPEYRVEGVDVSVVHRHVGAVRELLSRRRVPHFVAWGVNNVRENAAKIIGFLIRVRELAHT